MPEPKRKTEGGGQRDGTSRPLAERAREILQGLLDAGDELAAGLFGRPRLQPVMIPVAPRPRR